MTHGLLRPRFLLLNKKQRPEFRFTESMPGGTHQGQTWVRRIRGLFFIQALLATHNLFGSGPVPGINTTTPYLVYYGDWDSAKVNFARNNYRLVILHPASNLTAANIASIRRGPDNISGTSDDVLVLAYLSIGEDDRPGAPFVGDGQGPRVDPRASDNVPLSSITNALGLPSPGG